MFLNCSLYTTQYKSFVTEFAVLWLSQNLELTVNKVFLCGPKSNRPDVYFIYVSYQLILRVGDG